VERVDGEAYLRTISTPDGASVLEVRAAADGLALELRLDPPCPAARAEVVARARRMFDLDLAPAAVAGVLGRDPLLGRSVLARPGLRVPGGWDAFEVLVRAVLGQQVSIAAAAQLAGRIAASFGVPVPAAPGPAGPMRLFPAPAALASADPTALPMPRARGSALVALASAVSRGELVLVARGGLDASLEGLRGLPGVGPWTAQIVAMRALRERDAFPAGDLAVRRALGSPGAPAHEAEALARAEPWRPWRAYAAQHLWAMDAERRPSPDVSV
jgi:3-methyladenine DNA glycosylase/8-oxoguanine DNA glycosylase